MSTYTLFKTVLGKTWGYPLGAVIYSIFGAFLHENSVEYFLFILAFHAVVYGIIIVSYMKYLSRKNNW